MSGFLIISGAQETWTFQRSDLLPCRISSCFLHRRGPEPPASAELAAGEQGVRSTGSSEAAGSLSHLGEKENHAGCQLESHVFTAVLDFCLTCFWESRCWTWLAQKHENAVTQFLQYIGSFFVVLFPRLQGMCKNNFSYSLICIKLPCLLCKQPCFQSHLKKLHTNNKPGPFHTKGGRKKILHLFKSLCMKDVYKQSFITFRLNVMWYFDT